MGRRVSGDPAQDRPAELEDRRSNAQSVSSELGARRTAIRLIRRECHEAASLEAAKEAPGRRQGHPDPGSNGADPLPVNLLPQGPMDYFCSVFASSIQPWT